MLAYTCPFRFLRNRLFAHRGFEFITRAWLRLIWPENKQAMPKARTP